jgi:hypothetical protein
LKNFLFNLKRSFLLNKKVKQTYLPSLLLFVIYTVFFIFQNIVSTSASEELFIVLTLFFTSIILVLLEFALIFNINDVLNEDYHSPFSFYDLRYYLKSSFLGFLLVFLFVYFTDYFTKSFLLNVVSEKNYMLGLVSYNIFWFVSRYFMIFNIKNGIESEESFKPFFSGFIETLDNNFIHPILLLVVLKYVLGFIKYLFLSATTIPLLLVAIPLIAYLWSVMHTYIMIFNE